MLHMALFYFDVIAVAVVYLTLCLCERVVGSCKEDWIWIMIVVGSWTGNWYWKCAEDQKA